MPGNGKIMSSYSRVISTGIEAIMHKSFSSRLLMRARVSFLPKRADILHLNSRLRLDVAWKILALLHSVALVSFLIGMLELHVCGRARSAQHGNPVSQDVALGERPMTVLLLEFVRVEILPRGLPTAHQEQMVCP